MDDEGAVLFDRRNGQSETMPTSLPPTRRNLRQLCEGSERPFSPHPQVDRYFPAVAIENARRRLTKAIERGDGPGLVIGAPGTGKSLLLQVLAAQFHQRFDVVLLACARLCTRRALLQAIHFELGLPHRARDEGELRFGLLDHLLSAQPAPTDLLLLVDEAQSLPIKLLDELRIMSNLVYGGRPRVRLGLAGSPALEESFASPELESFSQRLAARCYLAPLGREETAQFVRTQLSAAGVNPEEICEPDACEAVFEATDGVPRLVNQLCDRAINVAVETNCHRIGRAIVQTAWSDLQQLPLPWESTPSAAAQPSGVIEFGGLRVDEPVQNSTDGLITPPAERTPAVVQVAERDATNPFDEPFAEEEVVLDNFASWSELFDAGRPRVENRRDRQFATLVQQALDAVGPVDEVDIPDEVDPRWPPIRLAVLRESMFEGLPEEVTPVLPHFDAFEDVDTPIVIVDDDEPSESSESNTSNPCPHVARWEYRRLFSRLRSG
jgi:type II secretory pathway predicted ATPase ExeA